jgi:Fe2+ transport system protein FeoA
MKTKQSNPPLRLSQLRVGEKARIMTLELPQGIKLKLLSYGLAPGDSVQVIAHSPLRGPISIQTFQNERIALRFDQARSISVARDSAQ